MNNITFKNEKSIRRIFKQPFTWVVLTVSNKNGYHKIALKKNLFNKTYTVRFIKNGQIHSEKVEVSIENIANQNISIKELGNYHIENINISLTNPSKTIQEEEKLYLKIDNRARKEEQVIKEKEIKNINNQHEAAINELNKQHEQEKQRTEKTQKSKRLDTIIGLKENLIKKREHHHYWHKEYYYGYSERKQLRSYEEDRDIILEYGIDFIIEKITKIAKEYRPLYVLWKTGEFDNNANDCNIYDDTKINMLMDRINKICEMLKNKKDYDDNYLIIIQGLYGLLAEELKCGTYKLCEFIREKNIDYKALIYLKYDTDKYWNTYLTKYTEESRTVAIDDYFNSLLNGVALFAERITGEDISKDLQTTLNKQYLMVIQS